VNPRRLAQEDYVELSSFLNDCFSHYPVSTCYSKDHLAFFARWLWQPAEASFALESQGEMAGVALCGSRSATSEGQTFHTMHLGPIAVGPNHRRRGIGTRLLSLVEESARERKADLLTLTAAASQGAHRLYLKSGFQIVEAYRPLERHFSTAPPQVLPGAIEVSAEEWTSARTAQPPRPGAIAETLTSPSWVPQSLYPRYFLADGAGIATLRWGLDHRHRNQTNRVYATQLIRRFGSGPGIEAAVEAACLQAMKDGAMCTYALPTVSELLFAHTRAQSGLTYRMAKPLNEKAATALKKTAAWDECCPAP